MPGNGGRIFSVIASAVGPTAGSGLSDEISGLCNSSGRVIVPVFDNRDLSRNGLVPSEGYATSGPVDAYDTPSFAQAAVSAGPVRLNLHYFR